MKRYLFLFTLIICATVLKAQTLRPDVLIIGNGNAAVASAIQAAQSKAKTILVLQAGGFDIDSIPNDLHSGVQATFLDKLRKYQQLSDTVKQVNFDKQMANTVLTKWTDSLKNLTVIRSAVWTKADRSGKGWVFKLSDGKTIRPEVFVNIADEKLNSALKIDNPPKSSWTNLNYEQPIYKTSVAAGKYKNDSTSSIFSLYQFLMPEQENLVYVTDASSMVLGQSAGAVAAYAGFYDVKISESNLKRIQGELVSFKTNIIPFVDVILKDPNWLSIQLVGITGMLKAIEKDGKLFFNPDKDVATAEIKQPMKDHFYKAQIWFDDYNAEMLTLAAAIDMICYVGNKAKVNTLAEIEKKWKTTYSFTTDFDLNQTVSRREFATLMQDYLPPFNITLDKKGNILR